MTGTRDFSPYLAIPTAIDFFEQLNIGSVRNRMHYLARYARQQIEALTGRASIYPDNESWYGSMALVSLPRVAARPLQAALWERYAMEVPIIDWDGDTFIRVSCHLYNSRSQIDRLVGALAELGIGRGSAPR